MGSQKNSAKLDSALHLEHGWNSSWCPETLHKGRDKQSHSYTVRLTVSLRRAWWVLKEDSATAPQPTPSIHTSSAIHSSWWLLPSQVHQTSCAFLEFPRDVGFLYLCSFFTYSLYFLPTLFSLTVDLTRVGQWSEAKLPKKITKRSGWRFQSIWTSRDDKELLSYSTAAGAFLPVRGDAWSMFELDSGAGKSNLTVLEHSGSPGGSPVVSRVWIWPGSRWR